jgi:hypothetical protein
LQLKPTLYGEGINFYFFGWSCHPALAFRSNAARMRAIQI